MEINEALVKNIIMEVLKNYNVDQPKPQASPNLDVASRFEEAGEITQSSRDEVFIAVSPAFGRVQTKTITGLSHVDVIREVMAGIEEEGLRPRIVRFYKSADVAFISSRAAKMCGSGIAIGIQSRGTSIIHQKDLPQLSNLELFPQAPLIDLATYRAIGKNAAKYAKGEAPTPVAVRNDQMARPKYQAISALLYIKECENNDPNRDPNEVLFK